MFCQLKEQPAPPWKEFPYADPDVFRCTQGEQEYWYFYIWMPSWCSISEEAQKVIIESAPSEGWAEWLMRQRNSCENFSHWANKMRTYVPLPPWEEFTWGVPLLFPFRLAGQSARWHDEIWLPYWHSLPKEKQEMLISQAPSKGWSNWLKRIKD